MLVTVIGSDPNKTLSEYYLNSYDIIGNSATGR